MNEAGLYRDNGCVHVRDVTVQDVHIGREALAL